MSPSRGALPTDPDPGLLGVYLNDHLAAATASVQLAQRVAQAHRDTEIGSRVRELAGDVAADRQSLVQAMADLHVGRTGYKEVAGIVAERLGRLKPNGRLVRRSPLSSLVEVEGLRLAVESKASCWKVLRELARTDARLDAAQLEGLLERCRRQNAAIERIRGRVAAELFELPWAAPGARSS